MNPIIDSLRIEEQWQKFLNYKIEKNHISQYEIEEIQAYIKEKRYLEMYDQIMQGIFPKDVPEKKIVNKDGTTKKRIVYSFDHDSSITLKFIAYQLYAVDDYFADNCYAFRRKHGVAQAIRRLLQLRVQEKYCLKVDIHNYFNSICPKRLLEKLSFVPDEKLRVVFANILLNDQVMYKGEKITEAHGAMAGIPVAPFWANVYLAEVDQMFAERKVNYFRYSDDILILADSYEDLMDLQKILYKKLEELGLEINHEKEAVYAPHEKLEFLGFSFSDGVVDLSAHTVEKAKARIRRKAKALMRWQRKKGLTADKAAKGFIRSMNHKFYGTGADDEFTWSRWFFPNITTDQSLKEIDHYMQQYIRYIITGRHYKGNYRISYETLKDWGYCSMVNAYYKKDMY